LILKLILIIAVVYTVYFLYFKKRTPKKSKHNDTKHETTNVDANEMIQCPTCGVYCELDEAILSGSKYYCSDECLQKA